MKLAMLTASFDRSLQEEGFIPGWVEGLADQVDTLVVILLKPKKSATNRNNIHFYELTSANKLSKIREVFQILSTEHRQQSITGVFSHMYDFLGVTAALWGKLHRVKSVFWYAGGIGLPRFSLLEATLKLSDHIVTASKDTKKRYQERYHLKTPITVLGHAIDTDVFKPLPVKKDSNLFHVGTVGRLARCKNYETLIKAVGELKTNKKITVTLALARLHEHPDYLAELQELIKNHESSSKQFEIIENIPHDQLPDFYNSLDLYIHPSLVKSVDKAGLEAICCGVPTLLSEVGYGDILHNDKSLLFNPKDVLQLAKGISTKIEPDKGKTEYNLLIQNISIDNFMKKLMTIFQV